MIVLFISFLLLAGCKETEESTSIHWLLDNPNLLGGYEPEILGDPGIARDSEGYSLSFNGVDDGLVLPVNPIKGWNQFTIEVLFKPASDGPEAQRFLHFQDEAENRGLIETRLTPEGTWIIDTFLYNSESQNRLALMDRENQHMGNRWYWVAMVYDGENMSSYVNGIKQLVGEIEFGPMGPGEISIGVRLNRVSWFKGEIREVRFHPQALLPNMLQQLE